MATLPGKRVRDNSIFGTLSSTISAVATTMSSADLNDLTAISGDHAIITLDPFRQSGDPEIVMVIAHTASSTSATIQRGMYGTSARQHNAGTQWAHAATVEDFADVVTSGTLPSDQFEGQLVYQTDTDSYRYFDGLTWRALGAGSPQFLGYNAVTANSATFTTTETELVSVTVTVPAGRRLKISTGTGPQSSAVDDTVRMRTRDGGLAGTEIGFDDKTLPVANVRQSHLHQVVYSPSAGTHTFTSTMTRVLGAGTITNAADAIDTTWILVEDITGTETPFAGGSVPVGVLAQVQTTSTVDSTITVEEDLATLSVNVVVPAGRIIRISHQLLVSSGTAGGAILIRTKEGATSLQTTYSQISTTGDSETNAGFVVISPTAGAHTYKLSAQSTVGTGTVSGNAAFPATFLVEDITPTPTAASGAPNSTLAYADVTSIQGGITAETDIIGLSVNVTVPAGRRIKVSWMGSVRSSIAGDVSQIAIKEDGTSVQRIKIFNGTASGTNQESSYAEVIRTPTAGLHTYKIALSRDTGTGSHDHVATATSPSYILVEDITGAVWPQGSQVTSGIIASEAWTPFTPTLTQSGSVTFTGGGRYMKIGRTVHATVNLVIVGAGTGGNPVLVGLPVPAAIATNRCGTGAIYDQSANIMYNGEVEISTPTTTIRYWPMSTDGGNVLGVVVFTAALAVNDQVHYSITYEATS